MSETERLPDQNHIDQIRERLWTGREFGQAAVMVGAGFSRNAIVITSNTKKFPLWKELSDAMFEALYPQENLSIHEREELRGRLASIGNSTKLASQYEAVFGRDALNRFLLKEIPDESYQPSKLHELLLSLPWSDVFTTNYDTLLEKTRTAIHNRKYDLVLTSSDIPGKMKPRIAKLHGSFPSHRPFIITEEDYRKYPNEFSPYVNMVQQSIMENAFCLIGFSGDDPNFLWWSGWVRDNLGTSTPPIYLCGLLSLHDPQRKVLEKRKIIPIDLSPLFPKSECPDDDLRHQMALEWFLLNLMRGEPPSIMFWPVPANHKNWEPSAGLPKIPSGPKPLPNPGNFSPPQKPLSSEDLKNLSMKWRQIRLQYPGWIVAPKENRKQLWYYTDYWIEPILRDIEKLESPENILLIYELYWRLDTVLMPIFMRWMKIFEKILNKYNPFPLIIEIKGASISPDKEEYHRINWGKIANYWIEIAFGIAREARNDHDEKRYHLWMDRLKIVSKQFPEFEAKWFFEECLFWLSQFNQNKVKGTLRSWPQRKNLPFWEAKRASVISELGELKDAEKITKESLAEIRNRIKPYSSDCEILSQEGWVMFLIKAIEDNKLGIQKALGGFRDRWEELRKYRCNPWDEVELLTSELAAPIPKPTPRTEIRRQFDPEFETETHYAYPGYDIPSFLPALSFIRLFEKVGLPFRCGAVAFFPDAMAKAAGWIAPFSPLWSMSSLIRTGKKEAVTDWFTRIFITTMENDNIDYLSRILNESLIQSINDLIKNEHKINMLQQSFSQRILNSNSEILSRICFRFSENQLDQLLDLAIEMYKLPLIRNYHFLHDCVEVLFGRILFAMPQSKIMEKITELLSLPIPTSNGFDVNLPSKWVKPFEYIRWKENSKLEENYDRSMWSIHIKKIITIVREGSKEARKRAIVRLSKLNEIDALSKDEEISFAEALWSRMDTSTGFPSDTGLPYYSFLILPAIDKEKAKSNFRKYILSRDFPRVVERFKSSDGKMHERITLGSPSLKYITELLNGTTPLLPNFEDQKEYYVDWTMDEATQILKKSISWWDSEKDELESDTESPIFDISESVRKHFSYLIKVLLKIVLPRIATENDDIKSSAKKLVLEMENSGFCILSILPGILIIDPSVKTETIHRIRKGINSMEKQEVQDSIAALFYWFIYNKTKNIDNPPSDLTHELINKVLGRKQPALDSAIEYLTRVIKYFPNKIDENQMKLVFLSLEYLITETEIPNWKVLHAVKELSTTIPIDDRPKYRRLSAELAFEVHVNLAQRKQEIPGIIAKWKDLCRKDPLPEVKKAWEEQNHK